MPFSCIHDLIDEYLFNLINRLGCPMRSNQVEWDAKPYIPRLGHRFRQIPNKNAPLEARFFFYPPFPLV